MDGTSYSQTFTYNKVTGALTAMTPGNGHTISLEYDALQRVEKVDTGSYDRYYTYRDLSDTQTTTQVTELRYGTDTETYFSYTYTYDELGNIATYSDGTTTYTYTYDDKGQLTSQYDGTNTYIYSYDDAGNVLSTRINNLTYILEYNNSTWHDLLTSFDGYEIIYDASGNPIEYCNGYYWDMEWDEGRNLVSASCPQRADVSYCYDQNGLRIGKTAGTISHEYIYAGGVLLQDKITEYSGQVHTLDFFYDQSGKPYAFNYTLGNTTTTYYYVTNLQGDVLKILDSNGTDVGMYCYDVWGKLTYINGLDYIVDINPLRYRGYYYDNDTMLYYLQSRYYDPATGRFINADSYVSTGQGFVGNNMFAYCLNNPVNYVDKNGKNADTLGAWASTMWWLCTTDSVLPFGDIIYAFGFLVFCVDAFSIARNDIQQVTFQKIDWGSGNRNHILKGTGNKHINGWRRFGLDPQDPNSWSTLLPILMDIVENTSPYDVQQGKGGGWVYYYAKTFLDIGVKVVVKIWVSEDGLIQKLSDAIPYILN